MISPNVAAQTGFFVDSSGAAEVSCVNAGSSPRWGCELFDTSRRLGLLKRRMWSRNSIGYTRGVNSV